MTALFIMWKIPLNDWGKKHFTAENLELEAWKSQIDEIKKHWQTSVAFLQEIGQALDAYGKGLSKTSKQFIATTNKLQSQNSANLVNALQSVAGSAEAIGFTYAKHAGGLLNYLAQKSQEVLEECAVYRKRLVDEPSHSMKELSGAQSNFGKIKGKYDKLCKEAEGAMVGLKKIKDDPSNAYQVNVVKRQEEKVRNLALSVQDMEGSLQSSLKQLNTSQEGLNGIMTDAQTHLLKSQQRVMQSTLDLFNMLVNTLKHITQARSDQAEQQNSKLSELANITLDLTKASRLKCASSSNEYLSKMLEARVNSNDERKKMIGLFKQLIYDMTSHDTTLTKAIWKTLKNYTINPEFKSLSFAIDKIRSTLEELAGMAGERATALTNSTADTLTQIVDEETALSRNMQATVQKLIRERSVVEEELLKEYEKTRKGTSDPQLKVKNVEISERLNKLSQDSEMQVTSIILENTNIEAMHLQSLKQTIASILSIESSNIAKVNYVLDNSSQNLQQLDPTDEFLNLTLRKRPNTQVNFEEIKSSLNLSDLPSSPVISAQASPIKQVHRNEDSNEENTLEKKFGIPSTHVIESFTCALGQKLPLHGRMYVTTSHLCFHSYFNATTLFGRDTKLAIPFNEVSRVEKRTNAMIFDNSLAILTANSEFFFTNFVYRDQAFAVIEPMVALSKGKSPTLQEVTELKLEVEGQTRLLSKMLRECKPPHGIGAKPMSDRYFHVALLSQPLELRTSIQRVFKLIFSDEGSKFWLSYLGLCGDTDPILSAWDPAPPEYFLEQEGDRWISSSCRTLTFSHPIRDRLPMMPKTCKVSENHIAFWLSKTRFIIEGHIKISGVTLCDTFLTHIRFDVQQRDASVTIAVDYGMEFIKSTIFSNKIETKGITEIRESINTIWAPLLTRTVSEGQCIQQPMPVIARDSNSGTPNWLSILIVFVLFAMILRLNWNLSSMELKIAELEASLARHSLEH